MLVGVYSVNACWYGPLCDVVIPDVGRPVAPLGVRIDADPPALRPARTASVSSRARASASARRFCARRSDGESIDEEEEVGEETGGARNDCTADEARVPLIGVVIVPPYAAFGDVAVAMASRSSADAVGVIDVVATSSCCRVDARMVPVGPEVGLDEIASLERAKSLVGRDEAGDGAALPFTGAVDEVGWAFDRERVLPPALPLAPVFVFRFIFARICECSLALMNGSSNM